MDEDDPGKNTGTEEDRDPALVDDEAALGLLLGADALQVALDVMIYGRGYVEVSSDDVRPVDPRDIDYRAARRRM